MIKDTYEIYITNIIINNKSSKSRTKIKGQLLTLLFILALKVLTRIIQQEKKRKTFEQEEISKTIPIQK